MKRFKIFLATMIFLVGCSVGPTPTPPPNPTPTPIPSPTPNPNGPTVATFCPQLTCNGQGCSCVGSTTLCVTYQCDTKQCECDVPSTAALTPTSATPLIIPMIPSAWHQHYNILGNPNVVFANAPPLTIAPDGLSEVFPIKTATQQHRFNYLVAPIYGKDLTGYKSITMTIKVTILSGTPVFEWWSPTNNCMGTACNPGSARMMIWGPPGDLVSTSDRWWATQAIPLVPGQYSLTVPLDGNHWTGVLGQSGATSPSYQKSLKRVLDLAITFGGGYFAGHGLDTANGIAQIDLINYQVNP